MTRAQVWTLYALALSDPLSIFLDPSGQSLRPWIQLGALGLLALSAASVVRASLLSRDQKADPAGVVLLTYGAALVGSGWINGGFAWQQHTVLLFAGCVLLAPLYEPARLLKHARWAARAVIVLSLYLAVVDYGAVAFTDNQRFIFGMPQLMGATPAPNTLGPLAAVAIGLEIARQRTRFAPLWIALAGVAALLSQSRNGWVGAGVILLAVAASKLSRLQRQMIVLWGAIAGVAYVLLRGMPFTGADVGRGLTGREQVWRIAIDQIERNPLLGGGPAVFGEDFREAMGGFALVVGQAHNQGLESAAQLGLVGVALLVALVVMLIRRSARADTALGGGAAVGLTACLLVQFVVEAPMRSGLLVPTFVTIAVFLLVRTPQPYQEPERRPARTTRAERADRALNKARSARR